MASRITELATLISTHTDAVEHYLRSNGLHLPSFNIDGPIQLGIKDPKIEAARLAVIEASIELHDLLVGPVALTRPECNASSLQAIYRYEIASKVPLGGEISFAELATLCDLYAPDLRRILRYAMCYHHIFCEPREGYVAHTAASRLIAEDSTVYDVLGLLSDETYQAFAQTVEALQTFKSQEPNKTGYSLAHKTDLPMYDYLNAHPAKAKRFAGAMKSLTANPGQSASILVNSFPWATLGNGTVVDVGGSKGQFSIAIAEANPNLKFVVQDRPEVIKGAESELPASIAGQIMFMAHDYYTQQSVQAEAYLFRWIFHNWPDAYCIKILHQLIPALRPGAQIIVHDHLLPEPNTVSLLKERQARSMDLIQLSIGNGRERQKSDWEELFRTADAHFRLVDAYLPEGAALGIVHVIWKG